MEGGSGDLGPLRDVDKFVRVGGLGLLLSAYRIAPNFRGIIFS